MANILASCEEDPQIIYSDIKISYVDEIRAQIPCQFQKRYDIYKLESANQNISTKK